MKARSNQRSLRCGLFAILIASASAAGFAATPAAGPYLEDLTWTELRDRIATGTTTVLLPIGGTEQSGPHLALGKHNLRVKAIAGRIAQRLGNAVVAPTVAYVPEGAIEPPTGHIRLPGTIDLRRYLRSHAEIGRTQLCQHRFRDVVLLGDHGGYQKSLERVAAKLNREWAGRPGCTVLALVDYYRAIQSDSALALKAEGHGADEIGTHSGLADTALMLAIDRGAVRPEALSQATFAEPDPFNSST